MPVRAEPDDWKSHAEQVASYYDANTQSFYLERWHPEDIHFGLFPAGSDPRDHFTAVKRMTECIALPADIRALDLVVDAGCGVGGAAVDIARIHHARVLGLTISPVQAELATRRAEAAGLAGLARFETADCSHELPCDDVSVDVILTIEAACHFANKPGFLRECMRVLKPGGRLVGSDWMASDATSVDDHREYLQPICDTWRLASLETPVAWRAMLAEAGFEVKVCEDLSDAVIPNAAILSRARLELLLEIGNATEASERAQLWREQYETLVRAWVERHFTIGRFFAVVPA
jgi:tocopherol O-methyltransferase